MDINVTSVEHNGGKPTFPMLMAAPHFDRQQIILATGESKDIEGCFIGTNINGIGHEIGHYSTGWSSNFKPWYGEVKIRAPKL
jgi:hypothetical protein